MNIRTRLAAASLAGLAIAAAGATTASAAGPTAGLPAASGRPVGVTTLNLTDRSRQDPWTHAGARRIVVSAFYPARRAVRSPARYVSPALADALAQAYQVPPAPGTPCAPTPGPAWLRGRAVTRSCSSRPER